MNFIRGVAFVAALLAQTVAQQPEKAANPDPGTGLFVGTVIDAVSGKPISGVVVALNMLAPLPGAIPATPPSPVAQPGSVLTGSDGRFMFSHLKQGRYSATAEKTGCLNGGLMATRPGMSGNAVEIQPGEMKTDLIVRLWKSSTIGGTVLDESGEPAVGIEVRLVRRDLQNGRVSFIPVGSTTRTDDRGMYRMPGMAPGDYVAFVPVTQTTMPTQVLAEYEKEQTAQTDKYRQMMTEMIRAGGMMSTSGPGVPNVQQVGTHAVSSGDGMPVPSDANGAPTFAYATTYYPAAGAIAGAALIHVTSGNERLDVNFQLHAVRTIRITGTLVGPDGPIGLTRVSLVPASGSALWMDLDAAATLTESSGAFTLLNVPQGQYTLRVLRIPRLPMVSAGVTTVIQSGSGMSTMTSFSGSNTQAPLPPDPVLWAEMPVSAGNEDIKGLIVTARSGVRVQGRVEFVGGAKQPDEKQMNSTTVRITSADGRNSNGMSSTRVSGTGELTSQGYSAGRYFVTASAPLPGWIFASAMHDGIDVSQVPLDLSSGDVSDLVITFTDKKTDLAGVLHDDKGNPDPTGMVVVFPADVQMPTDDLANPRRVRSARVSASGKYSFQNLPPGDYYVAGLPADENRWSDPQILQSLRMQSARVRVAYGQTATADAVTRKVQ